MSRRGFTIPELLVVLFMVSTIAGIAVYNFRTLVNPVQDAAAGMVSHFKVVRARALSSTSALTIRPVGLNQLVVESGVRCDDEDAEVEPQLQFTLPAGARLVDEEWQICFTSRGLASSAIDLDVRDEYGRTRTIEVLLGGSVRILPEEVGT